MVIRSDVKKAPGTIGVNSKFSFSDNHAFPKLTLVFFLSLNYDGNVNQTVTIEIKDNTVLQLLRNLAAMSLVKFMPEAPSQDDQITARLNEIYRELDSSVDPFVVAAQAEVLEGDDW